MYKYFIPNKPNKFISNSLKSTGPARTPKNTPQTLRPKKAKPPQSFTDGDHQLVIRSFHCFHGPIETHG